MSADTINLTSLCHLQDYFANQTPEAHVRRQRESPVHARPSTITRDDSPGIELSEKLSAVERDAKELIFDEKKTQ